MEQQQTMTITVHLKMVLLDILQDCHLLGRSFGGIDLSGSLILVTSLSALVTLESIWLIKSGAVLNLNPLYIDMFSSLKLYLLFPLTGIIKYVKLLYGYQDKEITWF